MVSCTKEKQRFDEAIVIQEIEQYRTDVQGEVIMTRNGIPVEFIDSVYVLEGDILLSKEQYESLEQSATRGAMLQKTSLVWPDGIVGTAIHEFGHAVPLKGSYLLPFYLPLQ